MPKHKINNLGDLQRYVYLRGIIKDLDSALDTATVTIGEGENEQEYQGCLVYYHCDPEAKKRENGAIEGGSTGFSDGDEVIVMAKMLDPIVYETMWVIGHTDGIRKCMLEVTLWNSEIHCFTDAESLEEIECVPSVGASRRLFRIWDMDLPKETEWVERPFYNVEKSTYLTRKASSQVSANEVCEANPSNNGEAGTLRCRFHSSKTLENVTVHAWVYYDIGSGLSFWGLSLDVDEKAKKFAREPNYFFYVGVDTFWCSNTDPYNITLGFKAYDVWKEQAEDKSFHYFVSCTGDSTNILHIFDITAGTYEYRYLRTRAEYVANHPECQYPTVPEGWQDRHMRLIGVKQRTVYTAVQEHYYGNPRGASELFSEDVVTGAITSVLQGCYLCFILNEFTGEIQSLPGAICGETTETTNESWLIYQTFTTYGLYGSGIGFPWESGDYYQCCDGCCTSKYDPVHPGKYLPVYTIDRPESWGGLYRAYVQEELMFALGDKLKKIQHGDAINGTETINPTGNILLYQHANNNSNCYCSGLYIAYGKGYSCTVWENYGSGYESLGGSVTAEGVGMKGRYNALNGSLVGDPWGNIIVDTRKTTEVAYETENFNANFLTSWPFYMPFALILNDSRNRFARGWNILRNVSEMLVASGFTLPGNIDHEQHFYFTISKSRGQ